MADRQGAAPNERRAFDAIVVGSGITGGWAAKELTERGLDTLVLEAGRPIAFDGSDFVEHVQPYETRFRMLGDRQRMLRDKPVQRDCQAIDELNERFFVNDRENPYTTAPGAPFQWFRGRQVGGRSLTWGRQVYRWSDLDFEANLKDGHGTDWPIRYADLAPWYAYVEKFIGVSGAHEGLAHLPDGEFLPPMGYTSTEVAMRERIAKRFGVERLLTIGRTAMLTRPHNGRAACHYCGPCERGCSSHAYFNSIASTLPAAMKTKRLTLRPHSVVAEVLVDPATGRARGVRVIGAEDGKELEFTAKVVFLCASAIESVRLLLNSRSARFPDGLANSSGTLGRYLMDHHSGTVLRGTLRGFEDTHMVGKRPNGVYVPRFRNVSRAEAGYVRGFGMQGHSTRAAWQRGRTTPGFGAAFKDALIGELGPWTFSLAGFGETLPHADNRVTLDPQEKDKWGIPAARLDVRWRENELAMNKDIAASMHEIFDAVGATDVAAISSMKPPGAAIHEMGGARMARRREDGVLNAWNQAWDVPNLFITDGAAMASSACQNPSMTYMALTARAAARAVGELKRRAM
ncbi:MAG: GMC family oxidoreductase [Gemmatimonadetes bacterium]|nr:GMC family oxidoreductase [Gemmatimonadota bacterium]